jgi:hypothetical protein
VTLRGWVDGLGFVRPDYNMIEISKAAKFDLKFLICESHVLNVIQPLRSSCFPIHLGSKKLYLKLNKLLFFD